MLPDDLLVSISEFLLFDERSKLKRVCQEFNRVIDIYTVKKVIECEKKVRMTTTCSDSKTRSRENTLIKYEINDSGLHVPHFNGHCVQIKDGNLTYRYMLKQIGINRKSVKDVLRHKKTRLIICR